MIKKMFKFSFSNAHIKEIFIGSSIAFAFKVLGLLGGYVFAFMVSRYYGAAFIPDMNVKYNVFSMPRNRFLYSLIYKPNPLKKFIVKPALRFFFTEEKKKV